MSQLSNYLQENLLIHLLRNTDFPRPATLYVALFTTVPTDAGGGVEVSTVGTGYARQAVVTGAASAWAAPVIEAGGNGFESVNSNNIAFPLSLAAWGDLVAFAIFDAPAGGNMWWHGTLTAPVTVGLNTVYTFPAGDLHLILR